MTDQSTFFWLLVVLGFILNFYMIYVTCGYIIEERKNKKIIDAANKKGGKSEAFGDAPDQKEKEAADVDNDDNWLDISDEDFESTDQGLSDQDGDGHKYRQLKRCCRKSWRIVKSTSSTNWIALLFNLLMMISSAGKIIVQNNASERIRTGDISSDYVDMSKYLN